VNWFIHYNKILIVDEAHGAHLKFSENLPPSSVEYGADILHSERPQDPSGTNPGAYLHVKGSRVDVEKA